MLNIITLKYWTLNILLDADTVSESEFLSDSDSYSDYESDEYDSETCSDIFDSEYESDTADFNRQIFSFYHHYQCEYGTRYKSCDCGCRDKP